MQDRVPLYPGRVTLTPVAGQANTYDMVRADQPTQEGTPLNKATLLKDATAAKFGKGTGAVPDDVLDVLSKSVLEGTYPVVDVYAGQNWEKGTVAGASGSVWQWICAANNILFSLPQSGTTAIMSTDGKAWTTLTVPAIESNYAYNLRHIICYANGTYYLIQYRTTSSYGFRAYSSADLQTWTLIATVTGLQDSVCGFFYSQSLSKFLIFDQRGNIAMSDDAVTWEVGVLKLTDAEFGNGMTNMANAECCVDGPDGFYLALPNVSTKKIRIFKISASKTEVIWESNAISWSAQYCAFVKFKGKYYVYSSNGIAISDNLTDWIFLEKTLSNSGSFAIDLTASDLSVFSFADTLSGYASIDGINFEKTTAVSPGGSIGNLAYVNGVFTFHQYGTISSISAYYTPDTTFKDELGLVDVLGNKVNIHSRQIDGAAKIEIGTYTGSGSSTENVSLVFKGKPSIVFVFPAANMNKDNEGGLCILLPNIKRIAIYGINTSNSYDNCIFNSKDLTVSETSETTTLTWSVGGSTYVGATCNRAKQYAYVALFNKED